MSDTLLADETAVFRSSAEAFLALVRAIRPEQWELPGLGVWDVRSLAGHTSRAILTVESYLLADPPPAVTVAAAEDYYAAIYAQYARPEEVAQRGVDAGVRLGADPAAAIDDAIERTVALIERQPPGRAVHVGGFGIELGEYLRTRVLELVVHTMDLSRATGIASALPAEAVNRTAALAAGIAARSGNGEVLLLALTGRGSLPEGFSVV